VGRPRGDYEAPSAEELLLGGVGGGSGPGGLLELDPADAQRLQWALDNNPESVYPEEDGGPRHQASAGSRAREAEDAAFLASLAAYARRHGGAAAGGPNVGTATAASSAATRSSEQDSDYEQRHDAGGGGSGPVAGGAAATAPIAGGGGAPLA
jgi:hypothetical protein